MTRRRWIADELTDDRAWLYGANAAHLGRVLRARVGQEFDIVCSGQLRRGRIVSVSGERVEFALGEFLHETEERELVLLMAIYKFDRLEWAIEKCTELGATRIVPVIARRTDAHLAAAAAKRVERWRRIAHEAAQQSRRLDPPQIDAPMELKVALKLRSSAAESRAQPSATLLGEKQQQPDPGAETRLLLNENERSENFRDALAAASGGLAIAVGPEGGWTGEELAEFDSAGWRSVTLGPTILRAETAAIAALAAARAILD
jgi:16S rRNA (uracil1498-N3)-methyltransferase